MERRYSVLRIIATVYKVLGAIVGVISILFALGICVIGAIGGAAANNLGRDTGFNFAGGLISGIIFALVIIFVGAIYTLILYGAGDVISLLIALEENTRTTSALLQQQARASSVAPSVSPTTTPK